MKPIKIFQKWNKAAERLEWSLTDCLSTAVLIYLFYFDWYFLSLLGSPKISINFIVINVVFLIAAFYPKYLKNLIDLKDKVK